MSNYKINRLSYIDFDHEPTRDELLHFKYTKREKVNGKWRYWYSDEGQITESKKYREYSVDDHKFYNTTERKVRTDSVFTPLNKTETYTDSEGETHKVVTDYEGKLERTVQTGADFIARTIKRKVVEFAFKRVGQELLNEYMKKAKTSK